MELNQQHALRSAYTKVTDETYKGFMTALMDVVSRDEATSARIYTNIESVVHNDAEDSRTGAIIPWYRHNSTYLVHTKLFLALSSHREPMRKGKRRQLVLNGIPSQGMVPMPTLAKFSALKRGSHAYLT
jgi:hypothetical protein